MMDNMASEIISGFDSEDDEIDLEGLTLVHVETSAFVGTAISLHDMPYTFVVDMMATPSPMSTIKRIGIFKLALGPDVDKLELATFTEIYDAVNAWVRASNVERKKHEARTGESDLLENIDI